jgi:hypothetical protein
VPTVAPSIPRRFYIDSTASEQRVAARANRTYQTLERILDATPRRG